MSTVIVQSLVGDGVLTSQTASDARRHKQLQQLLRYCVPSVQAYAARHGYSYIFHRAAQPHFSVAKKQAVQRFTRDVISHAPHEGYLVIRSVQQVNSCFERYYAMNGCANLYERFIYLDLDIYIKPNAPAMPHTKGVWAVVEWQVPHGYHAKRGFSDVPQNHQFNSGVLVLDRKGVKSLYDHVHHVKPDPRCTGDQDYFRLWSLKNKVNRLDDVWNYIVSFHQNRDGHFIHYVEKRLIERELASNYLIKLYSVLKSVERAMRQTRIFQFFRRLWKKRRRS